MNAQIVIFFIAAVFQANAAVPFSNAGKGFLGGLGGLQQIGNNVLNQGKEVIEHGKDVIEHGKEQMEEALEHGKEVIENGKEQIEEALETIEKFPDLIGENVLEEAQEHIHDVHEAIGDISPEDFLESIQGNLPGIPITPHDILNIAEGFNDMHTAACAAVSANFNFQNAFCKEIKDIFRDQARIITDQISRIIHSIQGRIVNLMERAQAVPPKTLDMIEISANKTIKGFEEFLTTFKVPKSFINQIIPTLEKTTQKNIEIAREYISYIAGSRFGNIIEEIKDLIGGGVKTQEAIQSAFRPHIEQGIAHFEQMQHQLNDRLENLQSSMGDRINSVVQSQIVQQVSQAQDEIAKIKEKYQETIKNFMDKIVEAAKEIQNINIDADFQNEAQAMIENAIGNVQHNFQEHLQNAIQVPNHPEISEHIQGIFKNPFEDLQAEIGKIVQHIITEVINTIKDRITIVINNLNEVENGNAGLLPTADKETVGQLDGTEESDSSSGYVGNNAGAVGWDDPQKIFLTVI